MSVGLYTFERLYSGSDAAREMARTDQQKGRGRGRGAFVPQGLVEQAVVDAGLCAAIHGVLALDCRGFPDPGRDRSQNHVGLHRDVIIGILRHVDWPPFVQRAKDQIRGRAAALQEGTVLTVVCYCRAGRHRSVAVAEIMHDLLSSGEGWTAWAPLVVHFTYCQWCGCLLQTSVHWLWCCPGV